MKYVLKCDWCEAMFDNIDAAADHSHENEYGVEMDLRFEILAIIEKD